MAKTKAKLATDVLIELRVLGAEETASAADSTFVQSRYSTYLAELEESANAYWSEDAIPEAAYDALIGVVAARVATAYGKAYDGSVAMQRLRAHTAKRPTGERATPENF